MMVGPSGVETLIGRVERGVVTSAVLPSESNYLVNVQHHDFRAIMLGKVRDLNFDPRLKGEAAK